MKKLLIIIIALAIVFIGMVAYTNTLTVKNDNITIDEINKIQEYINKIYMWKEVTKEALPKFDNINNASELWIWEVVKKDLEEYELTYEQINAKAKELFGEDFQKELKQEETESFIYDESKNKYYPSEVNLDNKEDIFILNNITRTENGYILEIIEYIEDYSSGTNITITNLEEEPIAEVGLEENETKIQEIVKQNVDKFSKKTIYVKKENENLIVEKVE